MIPIRLSTIIFLIFSLSAFSQKVVRVDSKARSIDYYVLRHQENGGFFRKNQELPRIIIDAALSNQILAYQVDYSSGLVSSLTHSDLNEILRKLDEPVNKSSYAPNEMSLIGIDLTEGIKENEHFYQFNYLNLYVPYHHSATTSNVYLCSFQFEDVIQLLNDKKVLWYPESFGVNNGIFTNYGGYTLSETGFTKKLLEAVKYGFPGTTFSESANISTYNTYDGYDVEIHLKETKEKNYCELQAIEIYKARHELEMEEDPFICSIPVAEFKDYLKHQSPEEIKSMAEVLLARRMTQPSATWQNKYENFYDSNFIDRELISQYGKFQNSKIADPLLAGKKLETQSTDYTISSQRFSIHQTETIDLKIDGNEVLIDSETIRNIQSAVSSGKLIVYKNDSLNTQITEGDYNIQPDPRKIELISEVTFDDRGRNKDYSPIGIGIPIEKSESIRFFCFEDLKEILPKLNQEVLLNRNFKGFIKKSSHISMVEE